MSNCVLLKSLYAVGWGKNEIWAVDSRENHSKCCHQMLDFKAEMYQNQSLLGLLSGNSTPVKL